MRVLFVYPALDCPPGVNHGLASLAGALRGAGHETGLIHVTEALPPVPDHEQIIARIGAFEPGLVAYSVMSQQYEWARTSAASVRRAFPSLPVIIGGVHCTMVPDEVAADGLAQGLWDYVCVGEGEWALVELCRRLELGLDTADVPNLRVIRGTEILANPLGPFPSLDELPPEHHFLFDLERITAVREGWVSLLASRGCPYRCSYCFNREIVARYAREGGMKGIRPYLRRYPVDRIVTEARTLTARLPQARTIIFDDDLFTLDKKHVLAFCAAYEAEGPGLPFVVNAHVQTFDTEMAEALARAGCSIVKFGLESGSPRVRSEVLDRHMSNESIARAFEAAHAVGLHSSAFIMLGLPTESRQELRETLELCARIRVGRFRWALFYPFPGTAAHALAAELGLIDEERRLAMGNYFDASCLRFGEGHDLFLEKLALLCHWWVNALCLSPAAPIYRALVAEAESLSRGEFEAAREDLLARDRALSAELLSAGTAHYSVRYSRVMGVHSDYLLAEEARTRATGGAKEAGA